MKGKNIEETKTFLMKCKKVRRIRRHKKGVKFVTSGRNCK